MSSPPAPALLDDGFRRLMVRAVVLPLALGATLVAVLGFQARALLDATGWVDHTDRVIARGSALLARILDGGIDARGYLLTGDAVLLGPFATTRADTERGFAELDALVSDNPAQRLALARARDATERWHRHANERIAARRAGASGTTRDYIAGKALVDDLRRAMGEFLDEEARLRDVRTRRLARLTMLVGGSGVLLGLGLTVGLGLLSRRLLRTLDARYRAALADERTAREAAEGAERRIALLLDELEARVADRTAELSAANLELEAFSYSVSHDLRAPLRAIDGFSRALEEDFAPALGDEGAQHLRRVRAACQRMGQLIDDLLGLSRVARTELARETVDLSALAHAVIADLRRSDPTPREIEVVIEPGLTARADPRLVRILLENLLGNALKFTTGTPAPRVEVGATRRDGQRTYFIKDNGAGFDMRYVARLFAPFQRLHRATEFEGSGIGLATVARIVHRHGGRISAEGAVGAGATFHFTLGERSTATAPSVRAAT